MAGQGKKNKDAQMKRGDIVRYSRPANGERSFLFVIVDGSHNGRVSIKWINSGMRIQPVETVEVSEVELVPAEEQRHLHGRTGQKQGGVSMSRDIIAEIEELEEDIEAEGDDDLADEAQDAAAEEPEGAEEVGQSEEGGDGQNARAMKNWPMSASEKEVLARRLVGMARRLIE